MMKWFVVLFAVFCFPAFASDEYERYLSDEISRGLENIETISDTEFFSLLGLVAEYTAYIDRLQQNADAMRAKEQSTANKLLGGATMAATGIGGMQAMSALAEQSADQDAEAAMKAYLATFHCNYGAGKNIPGGEKDVQLPGGNELVGLYSEYVNLANDLKVRKSALGMQPGIESESILDSATSGLYDDVAIGKTSGAFTSLARAMMDPNGADAAAWVAQKSDTAKQLKTGATIAGIGAVGGAVGNLLINKNAPQENSEFLLTKRRKITSELDKMISTIIDSCNKDIKKNQDLVTQIKSENPNWQDDETLAEYVSAVERATPLKTEADIIKIKEHPICN